MAKTKTREQMLEMLKMAEMEEGRTGLVDAYLKEHPEPKKKKETPPKDK